MKLGANRLEPFKPDELRRLRGRVPSEDDRGELGAAQDAGISLKIMRKKAGISSKNLAELLGISGEDLEKAERGQLVEVSPDGRLIDLAPKLLNRAARITLRKSKPSPT